MRITLKKLVLRDKNDISQLEAFVKGAIRKPDRMNNPKIINNTTVKETNVLKAIFWVRNTTIAVKRIEIIAITIKKFFIKGEGKKALRTV